MMKLLMSLAFAAVSQLSTSGVVFTNELNVNAPPAKVYETMLSVGSWWNPEHTYSGDAKNLSIDARAGGCFCEQLKNGGAVEHLHVVYVDPNHLLRMTGGLGPFQAAGVGGSMTWSLTAADAGTRVRFTYVVGGYMPGGFEKIAPLADGMQLEQLQRLKRFVETGSPAPAPPK